MLEAHCQSVGTGNRKPVGFSGFPFFFLLMGLQQDVQRQGEETNGTRVSSVSQHAREQQSSTRPAPTALMTTPAIRRLILQARLICSPPTPPYWELFHAPGQVSCLYSNKPVKSPWRVK